MLNKWLTKTSAKLKYIDFHRENGKLEENSGDVGKTLAKKTT